MAFLLGLTMARGWLAGWSPATVSVAGGVLSGIAAFLGRFAWQAQRPANAASSAPGQGNSLRLGNISAVLRRVESSRNIELRGAGRALARVTHELAAPRSIGICGGRPVSCLPLLDAGVHDLLERQQQPSGAGGGQNRRRDRPAQHDAGPLPGRQPRPVMPGRFTGREGRPLGVRCLHGRLSVQPASRGHWFKPWCSCEPVCNIGPAAGLP